MSVKKKGIIAGIAAIVITVVSAVCVVLKREDY